MDWQPPETAPRDCPILGYGRLVAEYSEQNKQKVYAVVRYEDDELSRKDPSNLNCLANYPWATQPESYYDARLDLEKWAEIE